MAGFGQGLAHALTAGLTGYREGADEQRRQLILLAAQQRQEQRQKQQDELARIAALTGAANAGLEIGDAPAPTQAGVPAVAVPDTASQRVVKQVNPTSPEGGAANPAPATPSQDGTVIGSVGGRAIRIPAGGVIGKAARDDAAKQAQRTADLLKRAQPLNSRLPDGHPFKLTDDQLAGIAADPSLYNEWAKGALGITKDPEAIHRANRLFDQAHPTSDNVGPNWQVVTTKDGSMVQVNPKTGETRPIGLQARDTKSGAQSIQARQQAAVIPELTAAAQTIDRFSDPTIMSQLSKKAGLFGNYLNTPEGRQLNQAITQFVTLSELAKGNKRPTEALMHRFHEIYAPSPGDDKATMEQKRRARQTLIQSVTEVAGQTGQHVVGATPPAEPAHVQTIDEMIRAGKSDAEIKAAIRRGVH